MIPKEKRWGIPHYKLLTYERYFIPTSFCVSYGLGFFSTTFPPNFLKRDDNELRYQAIFIKRPFLKGAIQLALLAFDLTMSLEKKNLCQWFKEVQTQEWKSRTQGVDLIFQIL